MNQKVYNLIQSVLVPVFAVGWVAAIVTVAVLIIR